MAVQYSIRRNFDEILPFLGAIQAQSDSERSALGFLPQPAYEEAALQRKIILLVARDNESAEYVGHLLFGGIFPTLRIRQIAIAKGQRKRGLGSMLVRALVAQGEREGYLHIVANVAADLAGANSFYQRNGFAATRLKPGGASRNRKINVRILQLETPSLVSLMTAANKPKEIEYLDPRLRTTDVPIYAIDLNVFFDAIRRRARSEDAGAVFEAALRHQIRIAASQEFVAELSRTAQDANSDSILALAKRIPNLQSADKAVVDKLALTIAGTVFPERAARGRLGRSDWSDVLHLAHAVAAGAAGYITSDAKILNARDELMQEFNLDVIGLSEFVDLLDLPSKTSRPSLQETENFRIRVPVEAEIAEFCSNEGVALEPFLSHQDINRCERLSVGDSDGIIGISVLVPTAGLQSPSRMVVCVHQEHAFSSTVADFLISEQVRHCANSNPCYLRMMDIPSHPITRRIAFSLGFQQQAQASGSLGKIALGYPITEGSWESARRSIERLAGLKIQANCPRYDGRKVKVSTGGGEITELSLFDLETLLAPTLLALPKRAAVIVPITHEYAGSLLDADRQFSLLELPEAQFLSRRTYFNTKRAARLMTRNSIMVFYESSRSRGRGAAIAVARIVDVTSVDVSNIPEAIQRGAVVRQVNKLTKSSRMLATTFDNLIMLPTPVPYEKLRQFGCCNGANFVSATSVNSKQLAKIIEASQRHV